MEKTKIYCLITAHFGNQNMVVEAIIERPSGSLLGIASHVSSSVQWAQHDIGLTSNLKHDKYDEMFGKDQWKLEWVPDFKYHPVLKKYNTSEK